MSSVLLHACVDVLIERESTPLLIKHSASDHIADLIAAAVSMECNSLEKETARFGASSRGRLLSALSFIAQRLDDPDLGEEAIAAMFAYRRARLEGLRVGKTEHRRSYPRTEAGYGHDDAA